MAVKDGVVVLIRKQFFEIIRGELPRGTETLRENYRSGGWKDADWKDAGEIDIQHAQTDDNYFVTEEAVDFARRTIRATSDVNAAINLGEAMRKAINEEISVKEADALRQIEKSLGNKEKL